MKVLDHALVCSIAQLTHSLASLTSKLLGKWMFRCPSIRLFGIIVQRYLFVAAMTSTRSSWEEATPSNWRKNSVLIRRTQSCSPSFRAESNESTSSMKTMEGCNSLATAKSARTNFSPSPTYLDMSEEAEMLKKVAVLSLATALANIVLPLPAKVRGR